VPVPADTVAGAPVTVKPSTEAADRPYNFSTSKLLGRVQIRVLLPFSKAAGPLPVVPVKQHTRLPDHRPPLRRDKPVRVSLPDRAPRYVFPSQDRSFIFIPRALRPNQQGLGRPRNSFGHGPSSRRTSAYGGSAYSPSVAPSRRSSVARDNLREQVFSPAGSTTARSVAQAGRPAVSHLDLTMLCPNGLLLGFPFAMLILMSHRRIRSRKHLRSSTTRKQPRCTSRDRKRPSQ